MNLDEILETFIKEFSIIKSLSELEKIKIKYLGRNGILNDNFKILKLKDSEKKSSLGKLLNDIKNKINVFIESKNKEFFKKNIKKNIDITLPGIGFNIGTQHIINKTLKDIEFFFTKLGFNIFEGIEIDTTYYNFDALNIVKSHPARNLNDTFYISKKYLLRTHTSNMQIHIMEKKKPPLKIISYGKVYRKDYDSSHTPMFHQIEGFIIDKNISISNLKYLLFNFLKFFFNKDVIINFRSSYFPFTEPSMEIDIQCINCLGKKCIVCKYSGWIEVLGCGMINPIVLDNCNINTILYRGIAFGMGIERLAMIKYNIPDIRLFFENNIEFLKQFN